MSKYLDMKIPRLYEKNKHGKRRGYVYTYEQVSELTGIPSVILRLLVDAGRLPIEEKIVGGENRRYLLYDRTAWYSAAKTWRLAMKQDQDTKRTERWIEGMKHRQEKQDELHRIFYERLA
jgi:hypothetical protein